MKLTRLILLLLTCFCPAGAEAGESSPNKQQLYKTLDSLIACQPAVIKEKEHRIRVLTDGMAVMHLDDKQKYQSCMKLYEEYQAFQFDSAFYYINRCMEIQQRIGEADLNAESRIALAHILAVTGIFRKAQQILDGVDVSRLTTKRRVEYYNQLGELNLYRSEMAEHTPFTLEYIDSAQYYRQLILQIAPKDSYDYIFNQATYICEKGDINRAIGQLERYLPQLHQDERRYSIVTSTLAYFYSRKQDVAMQEHYLLLSAICDMQGAIMENSSLRMLSSILLERGEYAKAYSYLLQASDDAKNYGSRLRSLQVARMAPLINRAYDLQRTASEHRTRLLLGIISVIALFLIGTIAYILSLVKKRRLATEQISRMNSELTRHNEQMQELNTLMKESNRMKDEYIGRFLELSSNLIYRSEERLKLLNRLARDRKMDELYNELKSYKSISEATRLFHQNFDTAFLNIYPDFIQDVNRLMTDENQFDTSSASPRLTTELRVLALIRLGISDNQAIADILRSSLTTIYTYRSKLKARAIQRDSFEDDIRHIATY